MNEKHSMSPSYVIAVYLIILVLELETLRNKLSPVFELIVNGINNKMEGNVDRL